MAACAALIGTAHAQVTIPFNFSPITIPVSGTSVNNADSDPAPALASVQSVSITIQHDFASDLTVKLYPPGSSSAVVLFDQIPTDSGGLSATLGQVSGASLLPGTYTFAPSGADFAQAGLNVSAPGFNIPTGPTYAAQSWLTGPFDAGSWRMEVTDNADLSGGTWTGAQFVGTPVPEPSQAAVAAAAVLIGLAAARRIPGVRDARLSAS